MFHDPEIRTVFKDALIICGIILLSTLTRNWAMLGLVFYGIAAAATYKPGKAICTYLLLTFLQMINHILMPRYPHFTIITRLGSIVMTFALIIGASGRTGRHKLPLGVLFFYLLCAALSSTFGYFPLISYLKIINFAFFILGLYIGTRNLQLYPSSISTIRHFILALILLLTYGSLLTLPFPSVAYYTSVRYLIAEYGLDGAPEVVSETGRLFLLSGITNNSQFLGPAVACFSGWLLCDMWLVKKRLSILHVVLQLPIPLICYMTRSRLALFVLLVSLLLTTYFCLPRARVSRRTKTAFWGLLAVGFCSIFVAGVLSEVKNQTITRWLRKTEEISDDDRSLGTAITNSRLGLIQMNLEDFRRNRFLGSGFQVAAHTRAMYASGRATLFNASVEKGLLPLMVLGETGIFGAFVFSIFLMTFYLTCRQKRYIATATLFTIFLSTNLGEATFFAPSGGGGFLWILLVVGGFVIDMSQYTPSPSFAVENFDVAEEFDNSSEETGTMTDQDLDLVPFVSQEHETLGSQC